MIRTTNKSPLTLTYISISCDHVNRINQWKDVQMEKEKEADLRS